MTTTTLTCKGGYNKLFHKILSAFSFQQQQTLLPDPLLLHFELRYEMLDGHAQQEMSDRKQLMRNLGIQVTEEQLQEKIPSEYIGRMSCWSGEKLRYQRYLKIQVEYVEKRTIVDLQISQQDRPTDQVAYDNAHCS